ncbi:MAG: hypothetical protein JXK07_15950 [Spirochaetes bacterium]|nr:hypothetical protein [Spirochaetota bacterium]MBN2770574.1 hypothetical protein [Spirochaetota bacterium]
MEKKIKGADAYYAIGWSKPFEYNRITASRILPDLPGILFFSDNSKGAMKPLLAFATWREGLRTGMRDLFDDMFSKCKPIMPYAEKKGLIYRYTVIDSTKLDLRDVFYWVLRSYNPVLNTIKGVTPTSRYGNIYVIERENAGNADNVRLPGSF